MELPKQILVVIKPTAMANRADILRRIEACEYTIIQSKTVILTAEQVTSFQGTYYQSPFYPEAVTEWAERPICAIYLSYPVPEVDCISHKNRLRKVVLEEFKDCVYISEDCGQEIRFFFGDCKVRKVGAKPSIDNVAQFLNEKVHPVLMKALWEMTKENVHPEDCVVQLAKKLMDVETLRDPVKASRWLKYDKKIAEISELKLDVKRRQFAKNALRTLGEDEIE